MIISFRPVVNLNLTDGQWNHICLVRHGFRTRFLFNGISVYNLITETGKTHSRGTFIIGQDLNEADGSFNEIRAFVGIISQVKRWSKGFDDNIIASLSRLAGKFQKMV